MEIGRINFDGNFPTPDAGLVAQAANQIGELAEEASALRSRLEAINDRLLGAEPKQANGVSGGPCKPYSDVDGLAQNIAALRLALRELHEQVARTGRL